MGGKKFYLNGAKSLTMVQQWAFLKKYFPDSDCVASRNECLVWNGFIQPTPCSPNYSIKLTYRIRKRPEIIVLSPKLEKWNGQRLPHTFSSERLCLYRNIYGEWSSDKSIATTIIPWTSLWLYFYEIWLATGKWMGGGEHPGDFEKDED